MRMTRILLGIGLLTLSMNALALQDPDLTRAEQLVKQKKYQEAYDLLSPFEPSMSSNPKFNYLLGRAALGIGQTDRAKALFERSLEIRPNWAAAHLGLGRAYYAAGDYARAQIEFETVFRFDDLPLDLLTQVNIYERAAEQYLEQNRFTVGFAFLEAGFGYYWEHDTFHPSSAINSNLRRDPFYHLRSGFGVNYLLSESYALDANLDYRFRNYFNNDLVRNDSDWRWFGEGSHTWGESNIALGSRGRVSYRGNGQYRNDYGALLSWRYRINPSNQLGISAEVRRRAYPKGPLRGRSRSTAEGIVRWTHALNDRANFVVTGVGASEFNSGQPDGHANILGSTGNVNFLFHKRLDGFLFATYFHHAFDEDRTHVDRALVDIGIFSRTDNAYEISAGLVWSLGQGCYLRPDVVYTRDVSNVPINDYHSTAARISVRKNFF